MDRDFDVRVVNNILESYGKSLENYREAMRVAGVPEALIEKNVVYLPDYKKMVAEDVLQFYENVKKKTILHFDALGFSRRSIANLLTKDTPHHVKKIVIESTPKSLSVSPEEVTHGKSSDGSSN